MRRSWETNKLNSVNDLINDNSTAETDAYKSSMGKFNYGLRPAKNIERKMFCETFASLSCIAPMSRYRYIGFGSVEFVDFSLYHQRLGITDMISIESQSKERKRVEFNLPYSCIEMKWDKSSIILPKLTWKKRTIIWLDYDSELNLEKLKDIKLVSGSLMSGSILIVTVDARPKSVEGADGDIHKLRYAELEKSVGKKKIPARIKGKHLARWGLAEVYREIIDNEIKQSLADKNGIQSKSSKINYRQLFNIRYADSAKMLTVGGVFLNPKDEKRMPSDLFSHLNFIRTDDVPYLIETPILTLRELRLLDKNLPYDSKKSKMAWIPKEESKKYKKVYRYFPLFGEVEAM